MDFVRVLVTGSKGQLGNELQVLYKKSDSNLQFNFVDIDEMDLSRPDDINRYFANNRFDFIINTAAYTDVDGAEKNEELAFAINERAVTRLCEICAQQQTRLIHISTDYVLDGHGYKPAEETVQPNPLSVYGKSKLRGEQAVLSLLPHAYIVRTSWLYSPFGKNFVKTIVRLAAERESISVVADQVGSPTYAADLAKAVWEIVNAVASRRIDVPGIYHYANEGVASWYDVACAIVRHRGFACKIHPIRTGEYPVLAQRPYYSVLDKRKISSTFSLTIPAWYDSLLLCLKEMEGVNATGS